MFLSYGVSLLDLVCAFEFLFVLGLTAKDTLITNGPIDKLALQGSAMKIESSLPRPVGYRLSLVRILFTYQNRREDLIYPVIQCDSWFVSCHL